MSKMKLIMERWKRTEKELNEMCGGAHQRDLPAYGRDDMDIAYGRDEWSFMSALNEPAMDRDDQTAGPMTLPTGEEAGARTLGAPQAQMTPASAEDLVDNFDDAFGLARSQGKVEFNYGGKPYTTQLDTETDIDWSQNLGMSLWDLHAHTGKIQAIPQGGRGPGLDAWHAEQSGYESPGAMKQAYEDEQRPLYAESKKPTKKYKLRLKG